MSTCLEMGGYLDIWMCRHGKCLINKLKWDKTKPEIIMATRGKMKDIYLIKITGLDFIKEVVDFFMIKS